jgi:hypothetical protein
VTASRRPATTSISTQKEHPMSDAKKIIRRMSKRNADGVISACQNDRQKIIRRMSKRHRDACQNDIAPPIRMSKRNADGVISACQNDISLKTKSVLRRERKAGCGRGWLVTGRRGCGDGGWCRVLAGVPARGTGQELEPWPEPWVRRGTAPGPRARPALRRRDPAPAGLQPSQSFGVSSARGLISRRPPPNPIGRISRRFARHAGRPGGTWKPGASPAGL